jgi:hypothetical protein
MRHRCFDSPLADQGSGALLAMIAASSVLALGLGLVAVSVTERAIAGNHHAGVQALYAAEALAEYVVAELRSDASWSPALSGERHSALFEPSTVAPWNAPLDLSAMTTVVQQETNVFWSAGLDTPQWRVFAAGTFETLTGLANASGVFLAAWVADDAADGDANPGVDTNGIVMVRADSLGFGGLRRSVVVVLRRGDDPPTEVVSWRELR